MNADMIARALNGVRAGAGWLANCPAHDDANRSLSIGHGDTQAVVVSCKAGCSQEAVIAALKQMGLWSAPRTPKTSSRPPAAVEKQTAAPPPKSLADLAPRYGLTADAFTAAGCTVENGAVRYPTTRPDGSTGAKFKTLARNAGGKRTCWHLKDDSKPGFFPASSQTGEGVLVVTGGEEKALAGLAAGLRTVTYTAGEGSLKPEAAAFLVDQGNREFIVAMDADTAGRKGAERVAEALRKAGAASVRVCAWPDDAPKGKDLNDILRDEGPDALKQFLDAAQEAGKPADADAGEAWGDIKAGRFLADRIRGRMLWVCDLNKWHRWDGKRWIADGGGVHIEREAKAAALARRHAAPDESTHPETKAAVRGCDMPLIKRAINAAQSEDGLFTNANDLDRDTWLLNVRNGTVDLRTGKLRPHDPSDRITKLCPVDFKPDVQAPTWERVVAETMCGDVELIRFLHLFLGYCLTGDCREQVFVVAHGAGQNGKGTLTRALGYLMGDYCTATDTSTIMAKAHTSRGGTREDLVALKGARLILASELNAGQRLDEAGVKALTGQDPITARPLYGKTITFEMTGKIFLACNHRPGVVGQDQGIWRRIRLVPFRYTVPPEKRDNDLDAKLRREAEGILAWLVRGCLEWHRAGRLPEARAVTEASEEYRNASDTLGGFFSECVVRDPVAKVQAGPLYGAYQTHSLTSEERPVPLNRFAEMLSERGFTRTTARGRTYWHGLRLSAPADRPSPPPDDDPEEAAMSDAERGGRNLQ